MLSTERRRRRKGSLIFGLRFGFRFARRRPWIRLQMSLSVWAAPTAAAAGVALACLQSSGPGRKLNQHFFLCSGGASTVKLRAEIMLMMLWWWLQPNDIWARQQATWGSSSYCCIVCLCPQLSVRSFPNSECALTGWGPSGVCPDCALTVASFYLAAWLSLDLCLKCCQGISFRFPAYAAYAR